MSPVNKKNKYLIKLKRGEFFSIEKYGATSKKEALELATSFMPEDPDWVKVTTRKGKIVYNFKDIQKEEEHTNKRLGIKTLTFAVTIKIA